MPIDPPHPATSRRSLVEAVVASTVGTTIEWYDFFLYGTAAALVFPRLFFPELRPVHRADPRLQHLHGRLRRPAARRRHLRLPRRPRRPQVDARRHAAADGRQHASLIGLLPTYDEIGVAAPMLLTLLRFLQGLGVGGEWGGAVLLALEYGHRGRRGFYASWPQAGVPLGLLASTGGGRPVPGLLSEEDVPGLGLAGAVLPERPADRRRAAHPRAHRGDAAVRAPAGGATSVAEAPVRETIRSTGARSCWSPGRASSRTPASTCSRSTLIAYGGDGARRSTAACLLRRSTWPRRVEFFTIPLFGVLSDRWSRQAARTWPAACS